MRTVCAFHAREFTPAVQSIAKARRDGKLSSMLFMVIERFKEANAETVGQRFQKSGRMLPEGVIYHASWIDSVGRRCFQLMEALDQQSLKPWISRWDDLIDFEIVPVMTSSEFWSAARFQKT